MKDAFFFIEILFQLTYKTFKNERRTISFGNRMDAFWWFVATMQ